jgi:carboxyl-terminal processing protease
MMIFQGKSIRIIFNAIDPLKRFFYKEDIEEFAAYEDKIDDQIRDKDLSFFDLTHERLQQRMKEVREIYKEILAEPFEFSVEEEEINTNYDEIEYVSSREELKERWRKQLKFSTLSTFYDKKQEQSGEKDESLLMTYYEDQDKS